jgi:hypothetical protein
MTRVLDGPPRSSTCRLSSFSPDPGRQHGSGCRISGAVTTATLCPSCNACCVPLPEPQLRLTHATEPGAGLNHRGWRIEHFQHLTILSPVAAARQCLRLFQCTSITLSKRFSRLSGTVDNLSSSKEAPSLMAEGSSVLPLRLACCVLRHLSELARSDGPAGHTWGHRPTEPHKPA